MRRRLLSMFAAVTFAVGGGTLAATAPAHASDAWGILCATISNGYLFASADYPNGGYFYLRTLHAGRGFRYHGYGQTDMYGRWWIYGHGAEDPAQDGWILKAHTNCP
jgi:hypothetical protein